MEHAKGHSPKHDLQNALLGAYNSGDGTDFTIVCKLRDWNVHSVVLWSRSTYFKAVCLGKFKEGESRTIDLSVEDPSVIDCMIQYCYGANCDFPEAVKDAKDRAIFHDRMFQAGEKYDMPNLKKQAAYRFQESLKDDIKAITTSNDADIPHLETISEYLYEHFDEGDNSIRELVIDFLTDRAAHLFSTDWFEGLVEGHPRLAVDIIAIQHGVLEETPWYRPRRLS